MKRLILYLFVLFALSACSIDIGSDGQAMDGSLEGKPVLIEFAIPNVPVGPSTKGVDGPDGMITDEPYLDPDKLFLAVCGSSQSIKYIRKAQFVEAIPGKPASEIPDYPLDPSEEGAVQTVTLYRFQIQLELSDSQRTIHFLGNIDENQLNTGVTSLQLLPTLLSYEGKQAYWQKVVTSIKPRYENGVPVMQNGFFVPDAATSANLSYIPLIRNYAKVHVDNSTEGRFHLHSYAVINTPKRGSVVPYRSNAQGFTHFDFNHSETYRFSGYEKCSWQILEQTLHYPGNLPAGVQLNDYIPSASEFEDPSTSNGKVILYDENDESQGFYVYERGVPTTTMDPTFIIIRGRFDEESPYYYYKLDLMKPETVNQEAAYQYYPLFRNFYYKINLEGITSEGALTPEAAANSSGVEDISADISMRSLADISNGRSRLVVEPFMARTYTAPNRDGYYELYARFFNNVNSSEPNTDAGAVTVQLEPMEDGSPDILVLYDDQGHEVHGGGFFYPAALDAQEMDGVPGFRRIRFNVSEPLDVAKMQKIKITGRNLYTYEMYPLYRQVEITLQPRQYMTVDCNSGETDPHEVPRTADSPLDVSITIPSGLPASMFPLEFKIEAEAMTLTPQTSRTNSDLEGYNIPVHSGTSISPNLEGKTTFHFVRTLTLEEYASLPVNEGKCTFHAYFKSNRKESATTIWVDNEYFHPASVEFTNPAIPPRIAGHFYVEAIEPCKVKLSPGTAIEYKKVSPSESPLDKDFETYNSGTYINLAAGERVYFSGLINNWQAKFICTADGSANNTTDGKFNVGGNIASLIIGDGIGTEGAAEAINSTYRFDDFFKGHVNLIDASNLELPMKNMKDRCYQSLFHGCTNLLHAPRELPATSMNGTCYRNMFRDCVSLLDAPALPAVTINDKCYQMMFNGCSSLTEIKMNSSQYKPKNFYSDNTTYDPAYPNNFWAGGVAATGTIYLNPALKTNHPNDWDKVVPAGWTIKKYDGSDWE